MTPELNLDFSKGEYRQWRSRVIAQASGRSLKLGTHFFEGDLERWYDDDCTPIEAVRAILDYLRWRR